MVPTSIFIIFWDFLMFYQIFLSPQVKQSAITSCRRTQDLRSYKIRKGQENLNTSKNYNLVPSLPPKLKILLILAKNCWKIKLKTYPYFALSHENYSLLQIFREWLSINLNMQNSIAMLNFSGKSSPKNQNCSFKLKFGT